MTHWDHMRILNRDTRSCDLWLICTTAAAAANQLLHPGLWAVLTGAQLNTSITSCTCWNETTLCTFHLDALRLCWSPATGRKCNSCSFAARPHWKTWSNSIFSAPVTYLTEIECESFLVEPTGFCLILLEDLFVLRSATHLSYCGCAASFVKSRTHNLRLLLMSLKMN